MRKSRDEFDRELLPLALIRNFAVLLAMVINMAFVFFAVSSFSNSPSGIFVGGFVALAAIVLLLAVRSELTKLLKRRYTEYYQGTMWTTPAGEDVTVLYVQNDGMLATVEFSDGYRKQYSLWTLTPKGDNQKVMIPDPISMSDPLFLSVSKVTWKNLEGHIGVVRGARRVRSAEAMFVDYITLKTDAGTREYERNYLTPVN